MRVVFLDIDGVLCTWESMKLPRRAPYPSHARFCQRSVANLNKITDATGAVIVVSSSWRSSYPPVAIRLGNYIALEGVTAPVIGQTPEGHEVPGPCRRFTSRGDEIQEWLDDTGFRNPVESFVIIDDDSDMAHLSDRLVHVADGMDTGLRAEHVGAAIRLMTSMVVL